MPISSNKTSLAFKRASRSSGLSKAVLLPSAELQRYVRLTDGSVRKVEYLRTDSVVIPQLRNQQRIPVQLINHPVLVGDPPGPVAGQRVFQGLRLADAGEGFALGFLDELVDALHHPFVLLLPEEVIVPGSVGKDQSHSASFRSLPCPALSCSVAASRRLAFAGLRSR